VNQSGNKITRRWFLGKAAIVAAIGAGGVALIAALRELFPPFTKANKVFTIGRLYDFQIDTFTLMSKQRVFVLRDHEGVRAMSAECTHLGCVLDHTDNGFQCPCHGSRFDEQGKVIAGPAPRSLACYKVDLAPDGQLRVDLNNKVPFKEKFLIR
jgi:nitrite reductase/ring-hydroxylating ferredoxin subunit